MKTDSQAGSSTGRGGSVERRFFRPIDVVRITGLGRSTVMEAIWSGELEAYKRGRAWLIPVEAVDRWVRMPVGEQTSDVTDPNITRIVGRIVRESTAMEAPHAPLMPDGKGLALVSYADLQALAEAWHTSLSEKEA